MLPRSRGPVVVITLPNTPWLAAIEAFLGMAFFQFFNPAIGQKESSRMAISAGFSLVFKIIYWKMNIKPRICNH